jgi:hypothetical protein
MEVRGVKSSKAQVKFVDNMLLCMLFRGDAAFVVNQRPVGNPNHMKKVYDIIRRIDRWI